jgi:hypothetical protein
LQPNISGNIKLSHGEAYLPHDRGGAPASNRFPSNQSMLPSGGVSQVFASRYVSRFFSSESPSASAKTSQFSGSGITLLFYLSIACDFINFRDAWINYLIDSTCACVVHYF